MHEDKIYIYNPELPSDSYDLGGNGKEKNIHCLSIYPRLKPLIKECDEEGVILTILEPSSFAAVINII